MIASVRWAPAAHWAGSPAEILLSDPTIRVLTAFASPAAGDGTAGLVGSSAKGSPMRSMFPLRRFCKTRTPTAPPATSSPKSDNATTSTLRRRDRFGLPDQCLGRGGVPAGVRVSWLGGLPADAVMDVLRTAHFSVLLSRGENSSHAIGESLLAGCPVLISDQTPWSFVGEQNAGIVLGSAECQDPDRIARQIDEIAAMTEADWRGMRLAARRCGEAGLVLPGTVTVAEALGYVLA